MEHNSLSSFSSPLFAWLIALSVILVFSCNTPDNKKTDETDTDTTEIIKKRNAYVSTDSSTYSERPVDSTYAEPLSGIVKDLDSKDVYIKIFPNRELKACGIYLEKIESGKKGKDVIQAIATILSVGRDFSCNLILQAYDYKKNCLGSSTAKLKGLMGDQKTITFPFDEKTKFQLIDYCTLGIGE